jgi:hypothetical protein
MELSNNLRRIKTMTNRLPVTTLDMRISTKTLQSLFPNEWAFIIANNYKFIAQRPEVISAIDGDRMSIAMILGVTEQMEQQRAAEEVARKQAEEEAAWNAKVAASKMSQNLTGGHR